MLRIRRLVETFVGLHRLEVFALPPFDCPLVYMATLVWFVG